MTPYYLILRAKWAPYQNQLRDYLLRKWAYWQPKIDQFTRATISITTAATTLRLSIQTTPIVLSVLTILTTAPILRTLFPNFVLEAVVLFPLLLAISIYAGYSKYHELIERARLDAQIEQNRQNIEALQQMLAQFNQRIHLTAPPAAYQAAAIHPQAAPSAIAVAFAGNSSNNVIQSERVEPPDELSTTNLSSRIASPPAQMF